MYKVVSTIIFGREDKLIVGISYHILYLNIHVYVCWILDEGIKEKAES
jgi:hypothetical protein